MKFFVKIYLLFRPELFPVKIYGLRVLNTNKYFYVGQTIQDVEHRLSKHISDAEKEKHSNKTLQKLLLNNYVIYDILEFCRTDNKNKRELFWIKKLLSENHPLVNMSDPTKPFSKAIE